MVEFASTADRDFYVKSDPAHKAYVESLGGVVEQGQVLDFEDGVF